MKTKLWIALTIIVVALLATSLLKPPPHTTVISLKNDLDLIIINRPGPLVSVQGWIRCGLSNESEENNGYSHFTEHMLFKKPGIIKGLEKLGAYCNGATGLDFTYYYCTLQKKHVSLAAQSIAQLLFNQTFDPAEFVKEKNVILEEIAQHNDKPENLIHKQLSAALYPDHPYGREILGTEQSIKSCSIEKLTNHYQKYYHPNNCTVIIAGEISNPDIKKIKKIFSKYTAVAVQPPLLRETTPAPLYASFSIPNLPTPRLIYAYPVPGVTNKDSYALDVLAMLFGNHITAPLPKALQEEQDLTYGIRCNYATRKYRSLFVVEMLIKTRDMRKLQREYNRIIRDQVFTDKDLELAKRLISKDQLLQKENIEATAFGYGYYNTIDSYLYEQDYLENIEHITLKDIARVRERYLVNPNQLLFVGVR